MRRRQSPPSERPESFDAIAHDLRALREQAGHVSYAELVRRIADLRMARGIAPVAASPSRSTVYNAFASGRSRMDTALLRDIVLALGESEEQADAWTRRCGRARVARDAVATPSAPPLVASPPRRTPALVVVVVLLAMVVLNHASHWLLAAPLDLPVYLDMIGTAVAAFAFGPWHGVAVALATGLTGPIFEDGILAFTLVNIAGALVWGYGIRRFRLGRDIVGFFALNIAAATVCSLVATPILVIVRGGAYGSVGRIAESLQEGGMPFLAATFTSNLSSSLMDKLITGFLALVLFALVYRRLGLPARHMPLVENIGALRSVPMPAAAERVGA